MPGKPRGVRSKRTITAAELRDIMARDVDAVSKRTEEVSCAAGEVRNSVVDGYEIPEGLQHLTREEIKQRNYGR